MLFQSKKERIQQYLKSHSRELSVFDELLADYLNGNFKSYFLEQGLTRVEIHIDWLKDYKCMELQGRFCGNYVDLQIEEAEFGISVDPDEPDIENSYELLSKEYVYLTCKTVLEDSVRR